MTQIQAALKDKLTKEVKAAAKKENIDPNLLKERIANGLIVIPANINHENLKPICIGFGSKTKVNANIGTSPIKSNVRTELRKLKVAIEAGADTIMDLSTSNDVDIIRKKIIKKCNIPIGTVPIYQAAIEATKIEDIDIDLYLKVLEKHAKDGVDFVTIHAGVTKKAFPLLKKRVMKCVSRGGSFLLTWMQYNKKENFLYNNFDEILKIAKKYDITLSLGDGLRPGCIADATDKAQIQELKTLGELAQRAKQAQVQVMIEGPGHIPLNQIEKNVKLAKKYCNNAPFYVLGPLPTDIATGYDHIVCAIGGALAAWKGADFLCFVSPTEHLGLPEINDIKKGVIATRIAAHIADIAKGIQNAQKWDNQMSKARANLNWNEMLKLAIEPETARRIRNKCEPNDPSTCSMCDKFCAVKISKELSNEKS